MENELLVIEKKNEVLLRFQESVEVVGRKVAVFLDKTTVPSKIRTQAEREEVAEGLTKNKDLQKEIVATFKELREMTHGLWKAVLAEEQRYTDRLKADEAERKRLQNADNDEQERIRRERQREIDEKARVRAEEERKEQVAALKAAEFNAMIDRIGLTDEQEGIFKIAAQKTRKEMTARELAAIACAYDKFLATNESPSPAYRVIFKVLQKASAVPEEDSQSKALEAAPLNVQTRQVENKAAVASKAAGTTFKTYVHYEVVDISKVSRKLLQLNETAARKAAEAEWAAVSKTADPFTWSSMDVDGLKVWTTKESADTGRRPK